VPGVRRAKFRLCYLQSSAEAVSRPECNGDCSGADTIIDRERVYKAQYTLKYDTEI